MRRNYLQSFLPVSLTPTTDCWSFVSTIAIGRTVTLSSTRTTFRRFIKPMRMASSSELSRSRCKPPCHQRAFIGTSSRRIRTSTGARCSCSSAAPRSTSPSASTGPENAPCPSLLVERRAQPMRQMPGGLLRDVQVAVEFHARDGLQAGEIQVDVDGPHLAPEVRRLHDRSGLDTEPLAAFPLTAMVRHLVRRAGLDSWGATMRAGWAVRPTGFGQSRLVGSPSRHRGTSA